MENRARNTFVLLTIVFAFALQCISAADSISPSTSPASVNPASVSPASVNPAQVNPAHVDMSTDHTENIAKTAPHVSNNDSSTQLINIEVYYEALCKDSVNFVSKELLPVYNKLNKFINVTFIPFAQGNITVNTDKTVNVTCRRDGECNADKVHACGINKIKESEKLIKFVNCSLTEGFNSPNKTIPIDVCGKNSSLDNNTITDITECANNTDTWSTLLQNYKNMSSSANVTTVPKILVNKVPEDFTSNSLMKAVCKKINDKDLPEECKSIVSGSDNLVVGVLPIIIGAFYIIKMI